MKYPNLALLCLLLTVGLFSCEKEINDPSVISEGTTWIPGVTPQSGLYMENSTGITIISNGSAWTNEFPSIDITGAFKDDTGNLIDFESLSIAGVQLMPTNEPPNQTTNEAGRFSYHFNRFQEDTESFRKITSMFDGTGSGIISAESQELGPFSKSFAFPTRIKLDLSSNESYRNNPSEVNLSDGLTIKWNALASAERSINSVGVAVVYNAGFSQAEDPAMPATLPAYVEETEDDGELYIPASALDYFPENSSISVTIARGDFETYTISSTGNNVTVNGVTYSISKGLIVVN